MNTVIAETLTHLLAFGLFVWILKRFAWGPLLDVLDRRRERIADLMDRAREAEDQAKQEARAYRKKAEAVEESSRAKLQEAVREGKEMASRITGEARKEAAEIIESARRQAGEERQRAERELLGQLAGLTVSTTERLLRDSLDASMQKRLVADMLDKLERGETAGPA
jgi:F-type H+-transporting ATPase subunit b